MNLWVLLITHLKHLLNSRRSAETIRVQQLKKFRRLVTYAYRHSPYYRELISARGIDIKSCVPEDFPVMTKSVLMEHFDEIMTDRRINREAINEFLETSKDPAELFQGRFTVVHTSGTSGEVGYFVYSPADWARGVSHSLRINPLRPGRRRMAYYGATKGHFTGVSFAASTQRPLVKWKYAMECFDVNRPIAEVIDGLNSFQPDILMGYPSSIAILAQRQLSGELNISPRWLQVSGEVVTETDWAMIESAFGVRLLNVYASTEHLIMGMGSKQMGGITLFEDELIFELESDYTLVTNLFNFTMPLIRYRMDDILERQEESNKGSPYSLIKNIEGRRETIPHFINRHGEDDFISPYIIIELLVKHVRRFQLQVLDKNSCVFRICLEPSLSEQQQEDAVRAVEHRLTEIFEEKDMGNVIRRVDVVDELPPDPRTGKFRLILV